MRKKFAYSDYRRILSTTCLSRVAQEAEQLVVADNQVLEAMPLTQTV